MRSSKSETHGGARPALLSPQPVILGVVLVILIAMFAVALQPGFRGGGYLTSILAIGIALVGVVFVRTATGRSLTRDEGDDDVPLKMSDSGDAGWGAMRRGPSSSPGCSRQSCCSAWWSASPSPPSSS
jgi:hypothetical protein